MYASTEYLRRRSPRGMGIAPLAVAGAGVSLVQGLFGPKRLASGVKQSVYQDEISDSRMQTVLANGTLASYIANVMLSPAPTPWGTAYSPEAIAWARAKLGTLTAGSQTNAVTTTNPALAAAQAAVQAFQTATGAAPATPSAPNAPLQASVIPGGIPPLVLVLGLGAAAFLFLGKPKGHRTNPRRGRGR